MKSFVKSLQKQLSFKGKLNKQVYAAYELQDYNKMFELLQTLTPIKFLQECRQDEFSLLHQVAQEDNVEAMQVLSQLSYFPDIVNDSSNPDGWSALLQAATMSTKTDLQVIDILFKHGADLRQPKKSDGLTVMHIAASTNDVQLIEYILQNTRDKESFVNQKNHEGWSAVHLASFLNNFDSLNYLLENGGELLEQNNQQMTSIDEIIRNDHKDLLECVYERIKNVTRETNKQAGFGLMHLAASQPESRCLRYLLEEERETPNEICNEIDQSSPLHFAVLAGDYHNVKVLLNNGAAPNNRDREGNTPMHLAVATRNLQLVRLLEENFGNADIKNIDGVTAYDIAITENLQEIKLFFISQAKYAQLN